ncbi:MAG: tandem-95 repeat protein, partial [Ilumatobacter sp.]|nr:tandem-95 repeat protein [Ilumatobacter sp.]
MTTISPVGAPAAEAATPPDANPALTSLTPQRFADTRPGEQTIDSLFEGDGRRAPGSTYEVQIAGRGQVPPGATGAIINLAAVNPAGFGFFTVFPCGVQPNASALNYTPGVTIANEVVAALSPSGSVCVFTLAESDVLIDVVGYTTPTDSITTLNPKRYADSRAGFTTFDGQSQAFGRAAANSTTKVRIGGRGDVPADAAAAIINVAAVDPNDAGFLTVHACLPSLPVASSINHVAGVTRANELIAELDANGDICIYTLDDIDMIIDVVGFVAADSDLVSVANARFAETRSGETTFDGILQGGGKLAAGSTTTIPVAGRGDVPDNAVAVVANIAAVDPDGPGFFTFYPCDQSRPLASSINYVGGVTGANEIVARLDASGQLCLFTSTGSHFILDVVGYLEPNADLTVTKDDNVTTVIFDDTIEYTVEVDNDGPDTAENVVVTDTLPGAVTFVNTVGCAQDPAGVPTCSLGDIAAGASKSFTVIGKVQRTIPPLQNLVEVGSDTGDPDLSNNSALEITDVNQVPPIIVSNGGGAAATIQAAENVAVVTDVQSTDHEGDVESGGLTYSLTTASGGGTDNALFTINPNTGVLAFAAAPNFENPLDANSNNSYLVQVTVTDTTSHSDRQNITVEVTNVNEPPNIFDPTAPIDVPENTIAVTDVESNDVDLDQDEGDGLTYSTTTIAGGGEDNAEFIVNPLTGLVTFLAPPDFEAPTDFDEDNEYLLQVTVTDSGGLTAVIDIVVNVVDANEAPTIVSEGGTTEAPLEIDEGTTAVVDVDSIDDADTDGAGLTYALTPTPATFDNEFFTIAGDGSLSFISAPDYETPLDANGNNLYLAQVTVSDSGGLTDVQNLAILVTDVNDEGPTAVDDDTGALEDTQLVVAAPGVLDNDSDVEGDDLTVVLPSVTTSAEGGTVSLLADGSFTYDPPEDFFGADTFDYQAVDALGSNMTSNVATVSIEVAPVNDAPSFTSTVSVVESFEDTGLTTVPAWATDIIAGPGETQGLTFEVTGNSNAGLFSAGPAIDAGTGDLTYTSAPDANGDAVITIQLVDDGGTANGGVDTSSTVAITIDVSPVNDEPSFTKGSTVTVGEDSGPYTEPAWATDISVGPADEAGQTPSFDVEASNTALFSVQPAIDATGELTFTPAANATGTTTVTVALTDDGGDLNGGDDTSLLRSFQINITAVNDVPVAVADTYGVIEGGTLIAPSVGIEGVRDNDTDIEDGTPSGDVQLITAPAHHVGTFVLNADGSFTYDHDGSESPTTDTFTYRVTDSAGAYSNIATATIEITPVNETPVAVDDEFATDEDTQLVV